MKHFKQLSLLLLFVAMSVFIFGQKYTGLTATTSDGKTPTAIFDGNTTGGNWQDSQNIDAAWIVVNLGSVKNVNSIKIYWENANAKAYNLSFSTDGNTFTGQLDYANLAAGNRIDLVSGLNIDCQYIKMQGVTRQMVYGYNIFEFEVYPMVTPALTSLTITPAKSSILLGTTKQFTVDGLDQVGNAIALTNTTTWSVDGIGASITTDGLFSSTNKGLYTVTATNTDITKTATIEVLPANPNLSIGSTATATSGTATAAIDNNGGTRWESATADPQSITIDFGTLKTISDIIITWETANAKDYIIESSLNGTSWTTIITKTSMPTGTRTDRMYDVNVDAQYIRLTGSVRNTGYGYSIWEFQIYGTNAIPDFVSSISNVNAVSVYPNPAIDYIYPKADKFYKSITVYNILGQTIKTGLNFSKTSPLNISDLTKGNYVLKLVGENGEIVRLQISKK